LITWYDSSLWERTQLDNDGNKSEILEVIFVSSDNEEEFKIERDFAKTKNE